METIFLNDFLDGEILREKVFREKVTEVDWSQYTDKRVLIKGCSEVPIPTWAYLIITAELAQFGRITLRSKNICERSIMNIDKKIKNNLA